MVTPSRTQLVLKAMCRATGRFSVSRLCGPSPAAGEGGCPPCPACTHYLREAARPISEADRHAKKELKKRVRQVRGIERAIEGRTDPEAAVIRGYCSAVRSALTDDGRPPLEASGLKLHDRLQAITPSLDRVEPKGGRRAN